MGKLRWGLVALAIAAASPAQAHHTFAMFDRDKVVTVAGTVRDFQWTNPHIWLEMVVAQPDGSTKLWAIEGGAPNALIRRGWKYSAIKVGDKVTVTIHPLKSGASGGSLLTVTLEDGRTFDDGISDNKT